MLGDRRRRERVMLDWGGAPDHRRREVLKELEQLLESPEFHGTHRGQRLIRHMVGNTLAGNSECLKERSIGVELFDRDAVYDTGQDAIVRVAANDVRKRLAEHYKRRQAADENPAVRISLPPGSYIPEFYITESTAVAAHENEAPEAATATVTPMVPPGLATHSSEAAHGLAHTEHVRPRRVHLVYVSVLICLAAACAVLALQNRKLQLQPAAIVPLDVLPWSMVTAHGERISVIVADIGFSAAKELLQTDVPLPEYANGYWAEKMAANDKAVAILRRLPLTTVADAVIASRISTMLQKSGHSVAVRAARSVQVADFKTEQPNVLLGSAYSNPWVTLFNDRLNFRIDYDPALRRQVCKNVAPRPGESSIYVPTALTGSPGIAYGIISIVPNLMHDGFNLIVAGTNTEGTEAAGELVTDVPRLSEMLRGRGIDPARRLDQLELLLRLDCMNTTSARSEIIAHRVLPP